MNGNQSGPCHWLYSRISAGISFLVFVFALGAALRLAAAECAWRRGSSPRTEVPMAIGNALHFKDLAAEGQLALARRSLRAALRLNPRDSTAWIALGLAAERDGELDQAADCFLRAEKVDRQYLPAWTSANFFFRRSNDPQFWRAAARAAAMSYDDPAPLIELTDHREPCAIAALERLGDSAQLERGYLRFLMGQRRWREAEEIAARLCLRADADDRELLLNFIDRLIDVSEGEAALAAWNRLQQFPASDRASRGTLVNRNFQRQPSGHGFDWRVTGSARGLVHWEPSKLQFWLEQSSPDACTLLEQWVVLDPGHYRLRFEYQTEGLLEATGLHWALLHGGQVEASSAGLARTPRQASNGSVAEWNFRVTAAGLYDLAWVYNRVPGTIHREGRAALTLAGLEMR